jgi:hypothetical protein
VFGVVPQDGARPAYDDLQLMRDGGVNSIRLMAHWGGVEPTPGERNWSTLRKRRAFRLRGVFWYSWRDKDGGDQICAWCGHAGLLNLDGSPKPALDAFTRLAAG